MLPFDYENFSINDSKQKNEIKTNKKINKILIISTIITSIIVINIILILVFVLKNKNNMNNSNENIPSISVKDIEKFKFCTFQTLKINFSNLNYYKELTPKDISFNFTTTENSTKEYFSDAINQNTIEIKIPSDTVSGKVILKIEKLKFVYEFQIEIINQFSIKINENIVKSVGSEMKIEENTISNTKNNYYIIYSFRPPCSGIYDIELYGSSNNDKSYFNVDIDSNLTVLEKRGRNIINTTQNVISSDWNDY